MSNPVKPSRPSRRQALATVGLSAAAAAFASATASAAERTPTAQEKANIVKNQMKEFDRRNQELNAIEESNETRKFKTELQAQIAEIKAEEIDEVKKMTSMANEAATQRSQPKRTGRGAPYLPPSTA